MLWPWRWAASSWVGWRGDYELLLQALDQSLSLSPSSSALAFGFSAIIRAWMERMRLPCNMAAWALVWLGRIW